MANFSVIHRRPTFGESLEQSLAKALGQGLVALPMAVGTKAWEAGFEPGGWGWKGMRSDEEVRAWELAREAGTRYKEAAARYQGELAEDLEKRRPTRIEETEARAGLARAQALDVPQRTEIARGELAVARQRAKTEEEAEWSRAEYNIQSLAQRDKEHDLRKQELEFRRSLAVTAARPHGPAATKYLDRMGKLMDKLSAIKGTREFGGYDKQGKPTYVTRYTENQRIAGTGHVANMETTWVEWSQRDPMGAQQWLNRFGETMPDIRSDPKTGNLHYGDVFGHFRKTMLQAGYSKTGGPVGESRPDLPPIEKEERGKEREWKAEQSELDRLAREKAAATLAKAKKDAAEKRAADEAARGAAALELLERLYGGDVSTPLPPQR